MQSTFLQRLKTLQGNLSNAKFARKIGVKPTTFQRYEEGSLPRAEAAVSIAEACDVSLDWLLAGKGKAPDPVVNNTGMADRLSIAVRDDEIASYAKKVGLDEETLRRYIAGREPPLNHLRSMAHVSGVSLNWLATGEGSPHDPTNWVEIPPEIAAKLDMKEQYVHAIFTRIYTLQEQKKVRLNADTFYFALATIHQVMLDKFKGEDASFTDIESVLNEYVDNLLKRANW